MDITQKLAEFDNRRNAINTNADLSAQGRQKAMQELDREAGNYRGEVLRQLRIAWDGWKSEARRNIAALREASERAAASWDYDRLNYAARTVSNTIAQADNFARIAQAYSAAKDRGDRHELRAWIETSSAAVLRKFGRDPEAVTWAKRLPQDAPALDSEEVRELKAKSQALTERGAELDNQTQRARAFYHPNGAGVFSVGDDFEKLSEGVKVARRIDVETLATVTTINLAD